MRTSDQTRTTTDELRSPNRPTHSTISPVSYRRITREELNDRYALTSRECEIAFALSAGGRSAEIAAAMGISTHTVRHHTERVFRKLGIRSRAAVAVALFKPFQTAASGGTDSPLVVS
jgi:DNA-binding NarL/FixJ family response regulator